MSDINVSGAATEVTDLAKDLFNESSDAAIQDGKAFLTAVEPSLLDYKAALESGELTQAEFDDLARNDLPALATMERLKQQGVGQVKLDRFTQGVVNIAIKAVLTAVV